LLIAAALGAALGLALGGVGCGGGDSGSPAPADSGAADADPGTPQRPPVGQATLEAWLAQAFYKGWACEGPISPPRLTGNHGRHRICSNQALLDSGAGAYPVGAASVKELFTSADQPNGFAVGVKIQADVGPGSWYWYERRGPSPTARPLAEGIGVPDCAVCHGLAPRDNVYIRAVP
jgi:hypothetical protein